MQGLVAGPFGLVWRNGGDGAWPTRVLRRGEEARQWFRPPRFPRPEEPIRPTLQGRRGVVGHGLPFGPLLFGDDLLVRQLPHQPLPCRRRPPRHLLLGFVDPVRTEGPRGHRSPSDRRATRTGPRRKTLLRRAAPPWAGRCRLHESAGRARQPRRAAARSRRHLGHGGMRGETARKRRSVEPTAHGAVAQRVPEPSAARCAARQRAPERFRARCAPMQPVVDSPSSGCIGREAGNVGRLGHNPAPRRRRGRGRALRAATQGSKPSWSWS